MNQIIAERYANAKQIMQQPETVDVHNLDPYSYAGQTTQSHWENSLYDGSKFAGGFGATQIQEVDYWTLRQRSAQLFTENPYARGIIRRLITNEINTGLSPETSPDEQIIGLEEDSLNDWSEMVENRFFIWNKNPTLCDFQQANTFGALQRAARAEALISGDLLIVLRQSTTTGLPLVQLVSGNQIQTPLGDSVNLKDGHKIKHGIELDKNHRHVAFWVKQNDGSFKRLPARGTKTGRRLAWMVYGTDKRLDDVRGQPLLSLVLQSLKEIDRYRDSAQRKAVINSILAMFIKKTEDKMGSLPVSNGAVRKGSAAVTDSDGKERTFNIAQQMPGLIMEELQQGEEPVGFNNNGTDQAFGEFEEAIIQAVAWSNEIPPEILRLSFSNNYSASQAAINEFKIYLNKVWADWGETFCTPIYNEWLLSEALSNKINAPGLLDAWRDPMQYDVHGAWLLVDWYGNIKPSTDTLKQAKGSKMLVEEGWTTNAREARVTTGTKFTKNIKKLKRENQLKVEAARPIAEFKKEFGEEVANESLDAVDNMDEIEAMLEEYIEENSNNVE